MHQGQQDTRLVSGTVPEIPGLLASVCEGAWLQTYDVPYELRTPIPLVLSICEEAGKEL